MPNLNIASDRVNDFVVKFANVNGTGSASANSLIMKAIFRMGVPVTGKNYFPSNIQGLPTWYEIRVTREGYAARAGRVDIMVAMNAETYQRDVREVASGGYLIYDSTWPRSTLLQRGDITVIGVPLAQLVNENFDGVRNRILLKNIAYAGVLAALLDLDLEVIDGLMKESYGKKPKLLDSNTRALRLGYDHAKTHLSCPLPLHVEHLDKTRGHIMIDGNTAAGLGCVYAGATVGAWYPITPSTSLMDAFKGFCERYRVDPADRRAQFCGDPGRGRIGGDRHGARRELERRESLYADERAGYFADERVRRTRLLRRSAVRDIRRAASRSRPPACRPARSSPIIMLCAYASHGDTRHVLLFPANPEECFHMAVQAFDLAERLQTPVFVLSDLDIGMNDWMCPELKWDDAYRPDRGKILSAEELAGLDKFYRYVDRDDDAITYRTLPGVNPKGAYFTRGSGHNQYGGYTEDSTEYQVVLDRLKRKFSTAAKYMPKPELIGKGENKIGIVSVGSCDGAVREAMDVLARQKIPVDYLRVKAFRSASRWKPS